MENIACSHPPFHLLSGTTSDRSLERHAFPLMPRFSGGLRASTATLTASAVSSVLEPEPFRLEKKLSRMKVSRYERNSVRGKGIVESPARIQVCPRAPGYG